MLQQLSIRVLRELGLGAVALCVAALVIIPILWAINAIYNSGGLYALLAAVIVLGVALLFYQAHIRPRLP
jgi:hypothetical protein